MGKTFAGCLLAFALVGATMAQRPGRRQRPRGGRDGQGYAAPPADTGYAAPSDDQPSYQDQDVYQGAASDAISSDDNLAMMEKSVPGVPGEDYPIYAEVPETGFGCEGQVDGGYYADPEAECQVFHICANDGAGGLSQYSFLCPNGTVFNQNYFICDWWFNFDCSTAEELYSLNDDIAAEREAIDAAAGEVGAASDAVQSYNAPLPTPDYSYDDYTAPEEDIDAALPADEYPVYESYDAPIDSYGVETTAAPVDYLYDDVTEALSGYAAEETTLAPLAPALDNYLPPLEEARRGRSGGRQNGRSQGRRGGRQNGRRGNNQRNQRRPNQRRPTQRKGNRNFRG